MDSRAPTYATLSADPQGFGAWWNRRSVEERAEYIWPKKLDYQSLVGFNLAGANLENCSLYGADMLSANLVGAQLSGADLRCILINEKTTADIANLSDCLIDSATLDQLLANTRYAEMSEADHELQNLIGPMYKVSVFKKGNLRVREIRQGGELCSAPYHCPETGMCKYAPARLTTGEDYECVEHGTDSFYGARIPHKVLRGRGRLEMCYEYCAFKWDDITEPSILDYRDSAQGFFEIIDAIDGHSGFVLGAPPLRYSEDETSVAFHSRFASRVYDLWTDEAAATMRLSEYGSDDFQQYQILPGEVRYTQRRKKIDWSIQKTLGDRSRVFAMEKIQLVVIDGSIKKITTYHDAKENVWMKLEEDYSKNIAVGTWIEDGEIHSDDGPAVFYYKLNDTAYKIYKKKMDAALAGGNAEFAKFLAKCSHFSPASAKLRQKEYWIHGKKQTRIMRLARRLGLG